MATQPLPPLDEIDLSLEAAAARANLSPRTLQRHVAEGRLKAYRVGGKALRFRSADLDALVSPVAAADPIEAAVERVVAAAPDLAPEQLDRLAALVRPAKAVASR